MKDILFLPLMSASMLLLTVNAVNMNGKPGQYKIANSALFSTDYDDDTEYFDVYSDVIKTRYSEVYWRGSSNIYIPEDIQERFENGKIMAVTGYEVDQVRIDENGKEVPVPITWAYNHHYGAWISNSRQVQVVTRKNTPTRHQMGSHGVHFDTILLSPNASYPITFFSEGNGGEFRLSYHGYPKGYAQLVESPDVFQVIPMQIDIWNRTENSPKFQPGPLPKSSRLPSEVGFNGLIECPCSDRLPKQYHMGYSLDSHDCTGEISNAIECMSAARLAVPALNYEEVIDSHLKGCNVRQRIDGTVEVSWNSVGEDGNEDRAHYSSNWISFSSSLINVTVTLSDAEQDSAMISLVGPNDMWFGIGFNASSMCVDMEADECPGGGPYAIIIEGDTATERKLDFHGPGRTINPSFTVESSKVIDEMRQVVLKTSWNATSGIRFDDPSSTIPIIIATGCGMEFGPHCSHASSQLRFLSVDKPVSVCQSGMEGTIGGNQFVDRNRCAPFPWSELLLQKNPTCSVETYVGGLSCCRHGVSLLDIDQEIPWPDQYLEYRLKFRFYFEEYEPATDSHPASHQDLVRLYWQTESFAGEYDIVPPEVNQGQNIQVITSRWQARDMFWDCRENVVGGTGSCSMDDEHDFIGLELIYAAPHCHAPHCLSMELYNADTGNLLCSVEPRHGESDDLYDERGFMSIPPCLWSHGDENLISPQLLPWNTTLLSIKRNNNTFPHTGEMASWQMRGVIVSATDRLVGDEVKQKVSFAARREEKLGP